MCSICQNHFQVTMFDKWQSWFNQLYFLHKVSCLCPCLLRLRLQMTDVIPLLQSQLTEQKQREEVYVSCFCQSWFTDTMQVLHSVSGSQSACNFTSYWFSLDDKYLEIYLHLMTDFNSHQYISYSNKRFRICITYITFIKDKRLPLNHSWPFFWCWLNWSLNITLSFKWSSSWITESFHIISL